MAYIKHLLGSSPKQKLATDTSKVKVQLFGKTFQEGIGYVLFLASISIEADCAQRLEELNSELCYRSAIYGTSLHFIGKISFR